VGAWPLAHGDWGSHRGHMQETLWRLWSVCAGMAKMLSAEAELARLAAGPSASHESVCTPTLTVGAGAASLTAGLAKPSTLTAGAAGAAGTAILSVIEATLTAGTALTATLLIVWRMVPAEVVPLGLLLPASGNFTSPVVPAAGLSTWASSAFSSPAAASSTGAHISLTSGPGCVERRWLAETSVSRLHSRPHFILAAGTATLSAGAGSKAALTPGAGTAVKGEQGRGRKRRNCHLRRTCQGLCVMSCFMS
jgi:hypothetical protein